MNKIKQVFNQRDDLLKSHFNLKFNDINPRVANLERHIEILYDKIKELEERSTKSTE